MQNISEETKQELYKCDTTDFNIFKLKELTGGKELECVLIYVLIKRDCLTTPMEINKMVNYAKAIQNGYKNIPYHNKTHGADLC